MKITLSAVVFALICFGAAALYGDSCSAGAQNCRLQCSVVGYEVECFSGSNSIYCVAYDSNGAITNITDCSCLGTVVLCAELI
jgi:hypothetical protein